MVVVVTCHKWYHDEDGKYNIKEYIRVTVHFSHTNAIMKNHAIIVAWVLVLTKRCGHEWVIFGVCETNANGAVVFFVSSLKQCANRLA